MKFVLLASLLAASASAYAAPKELSSEAVAIAQLVHSSGVRNCMSFLKAGGELAFDSITADATGTATTYLVQGGWLEGDVQKGLWRLEITQTPSANPEEGSTISCRVLSSRG